MGDVYYTPSGMFRRKGMTTERVGLAPFVGPPPPLRPFAVAKSSRPAPKPVGASKPAVAAPKPLTAPTIVAEAVAALRACGFKAADARTRVGAACGRRTFANVNDLIVAAVQPA